MSGHKRLKRPNVSIFKNAKSPQLKNTSITISNTSHFSTLTDGVSDTLKKLYDQVAHNAILNAGGRADEVKCYPGTREEVIGLIEHWMDADSDGQNDSAPKIMWLSGPAGAGKSAIVQTIAERCKERGVQTASFFFFRADPTRNTGRPLIATLLYQVFKFYPPARQTVATILSDDPLLFDASIWDQSNKLLFSPLQDIPNPLESPTRRPIVILIDGLDECDSEHKLSQKHILQALNYLVIQFESPFLVLVASRAEPQITMTLKQFTSPIQQIFLDDQYAPDKDIRLFVVAEFQKIKKSHHLAHTLNAYWPPYEDTESIVKKSSGQFIFAATVMRYIVNSSASPKLSLERVQGIAPVATNSPFAHLDAIYTYILSQVDDWEAVMDLLSAQLLIYSMDDSSVGVPLQTLLLAYNPRYNPELLDSCVADLTAILQSNGHKINFFHASLPDFLTDESRAADYYVDIHAFSAKILPALWANSLDHQSFELALLAVKIFVSLKAPTPDITRVIQTIMLPSMLDISVMDNFRDPILRTIHRLYYPHDVGAYRRIIRHWVSWYVSRSPTLDPNDLESRTLPYVVIYIWISQMEYWAARSLRTLFCRTNLTFGVISLGITILFYTRL